VGRAAYPTRPYRNEIEARTNHASAASGSVTIPPRAIASLRSPVRILDAREEDAPREREAGQDAVEDDEAEELIEHESAPSPVRLAPERDRRNWSDADPRDTAAQSPPRSRRCSPGFVAGARVA